MAGRRLDLLHQDTKAMGREAELLAEVEWLKVRLAKKDEVIAAVTAEMVPLKKSLGSSDRPLGWVPHDQNLA